MNRTEILEKLTAIFQDVFDDEKITIDEATTATDIEDWDSLTHIMLLSAIEGEFDVKIDMKAIRGLNNVGDIVDMIREQVH